MEKTAPHYNIIPNTDCFPYNPIYCLLCSLCSELYLVRVLRGSRLLTVFIESSSACSLAALAVVVCVDA